MNIMVIHMYIALGQGQTTLWALIGQAVSEKKMYEYYGHTHVYSPGAGTDNPLGPKYFYKHKSSVHLLIPSKFFFPIK